METPICMMFLSDKCLQTTDHFFAVVLFGWRGLARIACPIDETLPGSKIDEDIGCPARDRWSLLCESLMQLCGKVWIYQRTGYPKISCLIIIVYDSSIELTISEIPPFSDTFGESTLRSIMLYLLSQNMEVS